MPTIREYQPTDRDAVVRLSLRAWAPNFASMRDVVGSEIFVLLHGDWRQYQQSDVEKVLDNDEMHVWVADEDSVVVAFVAVTLNAERSIGEIYMLAVDPDAQNRGLGTRMTDMATEWMRDEGMRVGMIGTGGDLGHAAARRAYDKAGYTPMPQVNYFKAL